MRTTFVLTICLATVVLHAKAHEHEHDEHPNRDKRAVAAFKKGNKKLWPKGIVGYDIAKDLKSSTSKIIKDAMKHLQDHTCLQFRKGKQKNYILFKKTAGTCSSFYGMQGGKQELFVSEDKNEGCASIPIMTHEIMHALGIEHEMKRPDQGKFIKLFKDNIKNHAQFKPNKKLNYDGYKYDLSSVMQYDNKFMRKNKGSVTLETKNQDYNYLVSRATKSYALPSFEDIEILNDIYGCADKCASKGKCENHGYRAGPRCACQCPLGLIGKKCEKERDKCGNVVTKKTGTITTDKLKLGKTLMAKDVIDQHCSWTIEAADKEVVHLSFFDYIHTEDNNAGTNYIAIRNNGIDMPPIHKYGAVDHSKMAFAVKGSAMVEFAMKGTNGFGLGFRAAYQVLNGKQYQKACRNKVCYNGGSLKIRGRSCSCECRKGYKGSKCEQFANRKCKAKLPCLNRGVLDVSDKKCNCKCPATKGASVSLSGPRCQYFGQCHKRLDKKMVSMVAPKALTEPTSCKSLSRCDGTLKMNALCPATCKTDCECVDSFEEKKAGLCKAQKKMCGGGGDPKQAMMMDIGCQKTCKACPSFE